MVKRGIETALVHAGEPSPRIAGAVTMPVFQSSTFELGAPGEPDALRYLRLNNSPNHQVLHQKIAALEGAEAGLVAASGMAAISTALLALVRPGDHIIVQAGVYGGTHDLFTEDLAALDVSCTFVDGGEPKSWADAVRPTTKAFYSEAMTNPLLDVADLPAVARFAKQHGLISIIDNTFATPVNFRPVHHGFDLVVHSATKYLNGHSDLVAGAVAGSKRYLEPIQRKLNHLGGTLDPHAASLLHRGLKTLAVRVRYQNESALALARALKRHPDVEFVRYPGLPDHPGHDRAKELFAGFGGMLSFAVRGGVEAADRVVAALQIAIDAPSLGGPETLVTRPARTSHANMEPQQRRDLGIIDGLVRVSVGLESTEDLVEDFSQALAR